ncbi:MULTISPECIES: ApeA N-terminal domain 1-containing protein [Streptomyces rochei group]|uniref:ApeA N-terminal domain 1-containing protein n=1 Tax=Streptomyces rochei group TaxID=2867164 RepID=UPI0018736F10|nr:HEPN domain-containing protein [Streptomyces vinaceusdrappus]
MSDQQTPLRLSYEPDDYLCTWNIPDGKGGSTELPGQLEVLPNRAPKGSIYGHLPLNRDEPQEGVFAFSFPQVVEAPVLSGTLANGGSVVLLDAHVTYWTMNQGHVTGSAALLSKGGNFVDRRTSQTISDNKIPLVSSIEFQITALDALTGTAPIASVQTPGIHPDNPKDLWRANLNLEARAEWAKEGVELSVGYNGRMLTADGFEFRLCFSPVATVTFQQGVSLRVAIDDFVEPLRRISSIATGKSQDLTYVAVRLTDIAGQHQVYGTGITQAPFGSSAKDVRNHRSAIRAKADELSLLDLILEWRKYSAEHHPLVETYGSMLHAHDQHPRSRFLLLIQALEGLHGYETRNEYSQRRQSHLAKREQVIDGLSGVADRDVIRFLKKFLSKNPPTSLDAVLKSMTGALPVDIMDRIAATSLVTEAMSNPSVTSPANALRIVRNNLAHGTRGYDAFELDEVVRILELAVRAHSLRILGCPDDVVKRVFEESD